MDIPYPSPTVLIAFGHLALVGALDIGGHGGSDEEGGNESLEELHLIMLLSVCE